MDGLLPGWRRGGGRLHVPRDTLPGGDRTCPAGGTAGEGSIEASCAPSVVPERTSVHLAPPDAGAPQAEDVATALTSARERLGDRPALTVVRPQGREEQGFASLAQWAAKGAHLLELDLLLDPGEQLGLDAPPSWPTAAVCLAAWWSGIAIGTGGTEGVCVVHESRTPPDGAAEVFRLGDAVDGAPLGEVDGEAWTTAVQPFPDQPPPPRARSQAPALRFDGEEHLQTELLSRARELGEGVLGIVGDEAGEPLELDPVTALIAIALRPLVVGHPTVLLQGASRSRARGERVRIWR